MHSINTHRCSTAQRSSRVREGLRDRSDRRRSDQQEGLQDRSKRIRSEQAKGSFSTLVLRTKAYREVQVQQKQKEQKEEQEILHYYRQMLDQEQAKQAAILRPSLPLEDKDPIDVDKTSTISFTLKVRPGGNNEHTYKKTLRLFSEGSPFDWLLTMRDMREVWTQNAINGPADRAGVVRAILRDDALAQFTTALEAQLETAPNAQVTVEIVEAALEAVSASVFPHRALENQKLWMRRHMKKPSTMSYRTLQAKVVQMNHYLAAFPDATEGDRFTPQELLGILEFALPTHWRQKFDLDGYVPTEHDRKRLLRECEALERNEPGELGKRVPRKKGKKDKQKCPPAKKAEKGKYCREHGWGSHGTAECWTLHPDLMPDKFKEKQAPKAKGKPYKPKETHAMIKEAMKDHLHELLTTLQKKGKKQVRFQATKKTAKKRKTTQDSSDSDNSVHEMDVTPEPSDDETDKVERIQAFIAGELDESSE